MAANDVNKSDCRIRSSIVRLLTFFETPNVIKNPTQFTH